MGWGLALSARVLLREELGREPTREEVKDAVKSRPTQCQGVSPDDIKADFLRGKEVSIRYGNLSKLPIPDSQL